MENREIAIVTTITAVMISIPVIYFPIFQAQGREPPTQTCLGRCDHGSPVLPIVNPSGANMTVGSNMTGAAGNTSVGANGSSIHTTNPAARSTHDSSPSIRNVK